MNDLFTVQITDLAASGGGIARDESGRVLFIPLSAPGDRLKVRVTKRRAPLRRGGDRRDPRTFARARAAPLPGLRPLRRLFLAASPVPTQWRTKARGHRAHARAPTDRASARARRISRRARSGNIAIASSCAGSGRELGFLQRSSLELVPIERCDIARPEINAALKRLRAEGARKRDRPYKVEIEAMPDGSARESWNAGHAALGFRQIHDEQNDEDAAWLAGALTPGRVALRSVRRLGKFLAARSRERMPEIHCVDVGARVAARRCAGESAFSPRGRRALAASPASAVNKSTGLAAILDPPREGLGRGFLEIESGLRRLGVNELAAIGCDPNAWAQDVARFLRKVGDSSAWPLSTSSRRPRMWRPIARLVYLPAVRSRRLTGPSTTRTLLKVGD